ncbi:hypothetical protein RB653_006781 [Dictyostelium firmibasis]|uniref:Uncharacterized protein n=1 Tax=Dictyostelium firmibasis TaxID=79012 RepID=A0AAN7TUN4_9MYCE
MGQEQEYQSIPIHQQPPQQPQYQPQYQQQPPPPPPHQQPPQLSSPVQQILNQNYDINPFSPSIVKTQQYKFAYEKGHFNFMNGFSKTYPNELNNVLTPTEYNDLVVELNGICQQDPRKLILAIVIGAILIIVVPFSIVLSLILIPLCIILFYKRMDIKMQKVVEKYNSNLTTRGIYINIAKRIERRDILVNYPIDLVHSSQQPQPQVPLYVPQSYHQQPQQPQMMVFSQQPMNNGIVGDNINLLDKN